MKDEKKQRAAYKRWSFYEKTYIYCAFCGKKFTVPPSVVKKGKGKYCSRTCSNRAIKGKKSIIKQNGYRYLKDYTHPNRTKQNLISEHRKVVEDKIGRLLKPAEVVHHIDGDKLNNNFKNLFLCKDDSEHRQIHNVDKEFQKMVNCARYEYKEFWDFDITKNRQDQLQEMITNNPTSYILKLYSAIMPTNYLNPLYGAESMEQLLLMLIMQEKHNKTWDGEEWR